MEENNNVETTPVVEQQAVESNEVETTPVVEQPKKKGNAGLIVFLVILVLGLAGYICYDKFLAPQKSVKCSAKSTDAGNKDLKEEKYQEVKYTYEDLAGYYTFTKLITERDEDYDAELYLFKDGTIRFQQGPDASNGYIGNYIIEDDEIKVTKWLNTGSYSDLRIIDKADSTETISIKSNDSIVLSKCYTFTNCEFKKDSSSDINKKISSDGKLNSINDFLSKDHVIVIDNWNKDE